ncbi:hypothetical protein LEP1GSC072_2493 [Leptospira noguchii str. Bonito]|nr:hypothetical protein LEP1GSC072_2493 [Leptospira noguchii str. Bonito]
MNQLTCFLFYNSYGSIFFTTKKQNVVLNFPLSKSIKFIIWGMAFIFENSNRVIKKLILYPFLIKMVD